MSIELRPCPFCGGSVKMETHQKKDKFYGVRTWYLIVCGNTINRGGSCAVSIDASASEEAAAARWNMRDGKP